MIGNGTVFDAPLAPGVVTVMSTIFGKEMSDAGMVAFNLVDEIYNIGFAAPFHLTIDPLVKFRPFT